MLISNPKEVIRGLITNSFVVTKKRKATIDAGGFAAFLERMEKTEPSRFNAFITAIIEDVYEYLLWKHSLGIISKEENALLNNLDNAKSLEESVDLVLSGENIDLFFIQVYLFSELQLYDRINCKNNTLNVKVNQNILKQDKLNALDDLYFYDKGFIFSKEYKKKEYLSLFGSLQTEYNDYLFCKEAYINVIYGIYRYNVYNYKRLVLDMCAEYVFQKGVFGNIDKADIKEEYLLDLIKYADIDRILEVTTQREEMMDILATCYANYDYFAEERNEIKNSNIEPKIKAIIKKLNKGKSTPLPK